MGLVTQKRGLIREALKRFRRWWRRWRATMHLISFPKCGRTWVVLLISTVLQEHFSIRLRNPLRLRTLSSRRRGIPYIHQHHDGGPEFLEPEDLNQNKRFYNGRKVILLVRDPRDVLVSSYYQKTKRNYNYEGSFADFVRERRGGIESIVEFYNIWEREASAPEDFLLVTYEDLQADTVGQLRRIIEFIGIPEVNHATLEKAVNACTFERMREIESENMYNTGALSARNNNDTNSYKTRRGEVGGYREILDGEELAYVNEIIDGRLADTYARYRSESI